MRKKIKDSDIINKRFGRLIVVGRNTKKGERRKLFECICDCGTKKFFQANHLYSGATKSCGCIKKEAFGSKHRYWMGYGEIGLSVWNEITRSYNRDGKIKRSKKRIEMVYDITIEQAWDLFLKQERKCALSGVELTFGRLVKSDRTASLDRIDSNGYYTLDNVQWVHKVINNMKQCLSDEEFIKYCKLVAANNKDEDFNEEQNGLMLRT